ncbi:MULTISPECIES: hypothetical protein [unclassified Inquilinus]|uniref:hypothetical protein n=1 Tax=unclassified Inquilinus TaxID=2645927 RepID=UPI003F92DC73
MTSFPVADFLGGQLVSPSWSPVLSCSNIFSWTPQIFFAHPTRLASLKLEYEKSKRGVSSEPAGKNETHSALVDIVVTNYKQPHGGYLRNVSDRVEAVTAADFREQGRTGDRATYMHTYIELLLDGDLKTLQKGVKEYFRSRKDRLVIALSS